MSRKLGKLVVISGPSGVGKSTIVREVIGRTGAVLSVSATTRKPRPGETDGVDYRFVSRAQFDRMVRDGDLLEHAEVFGNCYGTPAAPVRQAMAEGRTVVLEIDVQGGIQVAAVSPNATFVLIEPPDENALSARLRGRNTDAPEVIERRLAKAREELAAAHRSGVYNRRVTNDDLQAAIEAVCKIVLGDDAK